MTTDLVHIRIIGGPFDGADLYTKRAVLRDAPLDGWAAIPLFTSAGDPATGEPYVAHYDRDEAPAGLAVGRWNAYWVNYPVVAAAVREWMDTRDPEARVTDAERGIVLCARGQHQWTEWATTPGGNRTRHCALCDVSQGRVT